MPYLCNYGAGGQIRTDAELVSGLQNRCNRPLCDTSMRGSKTIMANVLLFFWVMFQSKLLALATAFTAAAATAFTAAALLEMNHSKYLFDV